MTQIMLLQSICSISILLLEVPSWYFADIFWKKITIVVGTFFWFLWNFIYAFSHSFAFFVLAEITLAIGISALSWADNSFVYDTLKVLWKEKDYKKIRWNINFVFMLSMWISQILGWIIAKYWIFFLNSDNIRATLLLSLPFLFISVLISLTLKEVPISKKVIKEWYLKDLYLVLKNEVLKNKKLLGVMILFMFLWASFTYALRFYQPYFKLINLDIVYWWFVFWFFQIFSWLVSKYANFLEKKLWLSNLIILLVILVIISYFGMWLVFTIVGLIFTLMQQFVRWLYWVIISDYIHQNISSKYRATIQSIQNLGKSLIYALLLPLFWYVADLYNISYSLIFIWIVCFVLLFPMVLFLKSKKII